MQVFSIFNAYICAWVLLTTSISASSVSQEYSRKMTKIRPSSITLHHILQLLFSLWPFCAIPSAVGSCPDLASSWTRAVYVDTIRQDRVGVVLWSHHPCTRSYSLCIPSRMAAIHRPFFPLHSPLNHQVIAAATLRCNLVSIKQISIQSLWAEMYIHGLFKSWTM